MVVVEFVSPECLPVPGLLLVSDTPCTYLHNSNNRLLGQVILTPWTGEAKRNHHDLCTALLSSMFAAACHSCNS